MMFRGPPPPIIDNPEPEDVLFGRDSESWNHDGNKHFRAIVADYQDDYHSTKLRSRKVEIVARIIEELKQRGARFLKRDRDSVGWYEVDRKQVVEKVGHAIRDKQVISQRKIMTLNEAAIASSVAARRREETDVAVLHHVLAATRLERDSSLLYVRMVLQQQEEERRLRQLALVSQGGVELSGVGELAGVSPLVAAKILTAASAPAVSPSAALTSALLSRPELQAPSVLDLVSARERVAAAEALSRVASIQESERERALIVHQLEACKRRQEMLIGMVNGHSTNVNDAYRAALLGLSAPPHGSADAASTPAAEHAGRGARSFPNAAVSNSDAVISGRPSSLGPGRVPFHDGGCRGAKDIHQQSSILIDIPHRNSPENSHTLPPIGKF